MHIIKKIGFYTAFILPAITIIGFIAGGIYNYLSVVFVFIVLPVLDQWLGLDKENVPVEKEKQVAEALFYRFITYLWVFVQLTFIFWACHAVATHTLSTTVWIGFTISVGLVTGGIGITVAHELGHKHSKLERFYSKVLLMTVCYMHFYIEHNRGHHVTVATPEDPATARKDENFYKFWIKSVVGGYRHAWKLEQESLKRKNRSLWSIHNNMIVFTLLPILFCFAIVSVLYLIYGEWQWEVALFFFSQSIVAFTLLELVNYVEHYGIKRKELSPGKYERVNPQHSWNASHMLSNFFLFQLQRHSDHHTYAHKRYQVLHHHDESPQLPYGYPTMIVMAMIPTLWFDLMNRRLEEWERARSFENTKPVSDHH